MILKSFICLLALTGFSRETSIKEQKRLLHILQDHYERQVFPSETRMDIHVSFSLSQITDLNEWQQSLTTNGWFTFKWLDESLKWNISDYGGIDRICMSSEKIWIPDITLLNTVEERKLMNNKNAPVCVDHSGMVKWEQGDLYRSQCDFDISNFPFDTQSCHLTLTTWVTTNESARFIFSIEKNGTNVTTNVNGLWKIEALSSTAIDVKFPQLIVTTKLQRRASYYVLNLIVPVMFLSLLSSVVFALPIQYGDKVSLSMTVLLSFSVFLTQMSTNMPRTSLQTSYLTIYMTLLLSLSSLAVAISVLILRINQRRGDVPVVLQKYVVSSKRAINKPVLNAAGSEVQDTTVDNEEERNSKTLVTWKDVSLALDDLCLKLFFLLNVGCGIAFFALVM
ncbi:acetylcholine receptor subunit alpha-like 2 [Haliotis rubra]|uniref:acetylcholine receptor subunit alpha-like 2 n=1 Tax=Haliotis rubra TaxID=36100 RepID=UPI001EE4FE15|nr:acetylcholine receptor subunit alpha-like 2 [Haliotis rubra]